MKMWILVGLAAATVLPLAANSVDDQQMSIPATDQSIMFKKILAYDRVLRRAGGTTVFLVGAERDDAAVHELVKAFRDVGIAPAVVAKGENLELASGEQILVAVEGGGVHTSEDWASGRSMVYPMPGADLERIKQFCVEAGVLSISGVPSLAEQGHVSVGVGKNDRGQEIVVNMDRLKAEKHELSAELLRLARVIR